MGKATQQGREAKVRRANKDRGMTLGSAVRVRRRTLNSETDDEEEEADLENLFRLELVQSAASLPPSAFRLPPPAYSLLRPPRRRARLRPVDRPTQSDIS
jgi:hypothetical protein